MLKRKSSLLNAIETLKKKRHKQSNLSNNSSFSSATETNVLPVQKLNSWGWKPVLNSNSFIGAEGNDFTDFGAVLELEELDGVNVIFDSKNTKFIEFQKTPQFKPSKKEKKSFTEPMPEKEMKQLGFIQIDSELPNDPKEKNKHVPKKKLTSQKETSNMEEKLFHLDTPIIELTSLSSENETDEKASITQAHTKKGTSTTSHSSTSLQQRSHSNTSTLSTSTQASNSSLPLTIEVLPNDLDLTKFNAWIQLSKHLHPWILKGIQTLGFETPTPIQEQVLPFALNTTSHIVGAAPTGSGKTLAFGLPIINSIVRASEKNHLFALILTPTRELALQITTHLRECIHPFSYSNAQHHRVNIVPIVGGIAEEKQRRLLSKTPHILVATPGRLYDLINAGFVQEQLLKTLDFLVLDEADKMLETGKFKELEDILAMITSSSETSLHSLGIEEPVYSRERLQISKEPTSELIPKEASVSSSTSPRIFVFSATLPTETSPFSSSTSTTLSSKKQKTSKKQRPQVTLKELLKKLNLKRYKLIDLTSDQKLASTLLESKLMCLQEEKDLYLYYLLSEHPGKTLVFVNAISCLRRMVPLFSMLNLPVFPLHAQMQQRQRFKNLERFSKTPHGILMASDLASRGLDIPKVDHVIHYQVPRSSDLYIHRSGRTARAQASGLSIVMVTPNEAMGYKKICQQLGHSDLKETPVDGSKLNVLKQRLTVAMQIEKLMHQSKKQHVEKNWMTKAAKALEIELDDASATDSDEDQRHKKRTKTKLEQLQFQLKSLMKQ